VKEKIFQVVANVLNVPINSINLSSSPDSLPEWNSLKHMNLVLALEQEFGMVFSQRDIIEMLNVELIVQIIKENLDRSKSS
jgi:acyl carrier protein